MAVACAEAGLDDVTSGALIGACSVSAVGATFALVQLHGELATMNTTAAYGRTVRRGSRVTRSD